MIEIMEINTFSVVITMALSIRRPSTNGAAAGSDLQRKNFLF